MRLKHAETDITKNNFDLILSYTSSVTLLQQVMSKRRIELNKRNKYDKKIVDVIPLIVQ